MASYSDAEILTARAHLGISPSERVFASIGHLSKPKDRPTLLQALGILHAAGRLHTTLCLVVGAGEEEQATRALIDELGLSRVVRVLTDITDVTDICNIADFFVLSSLQEGLPYALLEAASLSKPHVATNVGGVGEFIRNGETGLLVPPSAPKELAAAIGYLLGNREDVQRLGINAKRRFEENHSYEQFIENTISFYRSALQAP
jgi:glycosyltransferase involved in cell wall biosynthesis